MNQSHRKTALAAAVAGLFGASGQAEAQVLNFSWTGAFTLLSIAGAPIVNSPTDWAAGYYAIPGPAHGSTTAFGWYGNRTPVSGTMSFDTSTGASVGTLTPFSFFADSTERVAQAISMTFQTADTIGTLIGTMLFSWGGGAHPFSMVLDASGLLANLPVMIASGATSTVSGVGALPASNGLDFDASAKGVKTFPLGPSPIATMTTNTNPVCAGVAIAASTTSPFVGITSIATLPAYTTCFPTSNDTIGGSPVPSGSLAGFNPNFDVTSISLVQVTPSSVPIPSAAWLFGSGLAVLATLRRRSRPPV
jgi:hypothetical protein